MENKLLTIDEICIYLNTTRSHIRSLVFKNKIPYMRVGGLIRFDKEAVHNWALERNED